MTNDKGDKGLAGAIELGLGIGVGLAMAEIYLSSAENWAQASAASVRQQNNTAMVELVVATRCCNELLAGRPAPITPPARDLAISSTEKLAELSLGAPVVT